MTLLLWWEGREAPLEATEPQHQRGKKGEEEGEKKEEKKERKTERKKDKHDKSVSEESFQQT